MGLPGRSGLEGRVVKGGSSIALLVPSYTPSDRKVIPCEIAPFDRATRWECPQDPPLVLRPNRGRWGLMPRDLLTTHSGSLVLSWVDPIYKDSWPSSAGVVATKTALLGTSNEPMSVQCAGLLDTTTSATHVPPRHQSPRGRHHGQAGSTMPSVRARCCSRGGGEVPPGTQLASHLMTQTVTVSALGFNRRHSKLASRQTPPASAGSPQGLRRTSQCRGFAYMIARP